MTELLALAERVEAASGADREIDALIWCAVCPPDAEYTADDWHQNRPRPAHKESVGLTLPEWLERWPDQTAEMANAYSVLHYTASLDAAMSLVPEGWEWMVRGPRKKVERVPGLCFVRVESPDFDSVTYGKGETWITDILVGQYSEAVAATPALALTAAALRARAA